MATNCGSFYEQTRAELRLVLSFFFAPTIISEQVGFFYILGHRILDRHRRLTLQSQLVSRAVNLRSWIILGPDRRLFISELPLGFADEPSRTAFGFNEHLPY